MKAMKFIWDKNEGPEGILATSHSLNEFTSARLRNDTKVFDEIGASHTDTLVDEREGLGFFVVLDLDV